MVQLTKESWLDFFGVFKVTLTLTLNNLVFVLCLESIFPGHSLILFSLDGQNNKSHTPYVSKDHPAKNMPHTSLHLISSSYFSLLRTLSLVRLDDPTIDIFLSFLFFSVSASLYSTCLCRLLSPSSASQSQWHWPLLIPTKKENSK